MLLFPGEGVRQVLDVLWLVFLHLRVKRLQDFPHQRADLLRDAARLLDLVNLQQTVCKPVNRSRLTGNNLTTVTADFATS